tara:strand:+ start:223 stop:573 length:351 start_codon:yes stop_codon:yes gene_type:complete
MNLERLFKIILTGFLTVGSVEFLKYIFSFDKDFQFILYPIFFIFFFYTFNRKNITSTMAWLFDTFLIVFSTTVSLFLLDRLLNLDITTLSHSILFFTLVIFFAFIIQNRRTKLNKK